MKAFKKRDRDGSMLIGLVLVILFLSTLTLLFVNRIGSREFLASGYTRPNQARQYAQSGIEYALQYACDHSEFIESDNSLSLNVPEAVLTIDYAKKSDILTSTSVMSGTSAEQYAVRVSDFSKYIPPRNIYAYPILEGNPKKVWINSGLACDSASGSNGTYARITSSHNNKRQAFTGFDTPGNSSSIIKVEAIVTYYLPSNLTKGNFDVRWSRLSDNKKGSYSTVNYSTLNSNVDSNGIGTLLLDMGTASNIGGWRWSYFSPPADFQIEMRTRSLKSGENIYIDCAGYKITW